MLSLLGLVLGCSRHPLVAIAGATRFAFVPTGDIVVGTTTGELVGVNAFGDTWPVARGLGGAVLEVQSSPTAIIWALTDDGTLHRGTPWTPFVSVAEGVRGALYDCGALVLATENDAGPWGDATALGEGWCDAPPVRGTAAGFVGGTRVSESAIVRVAPSRDGTLWVDAAGRSGCIGCEGPPTDAHVLDARKVYERPFPQDALVWLDKTGALFLD